MKNLIILVLLTLGVSCTNPCPILVKRDVTVISSDTITHTVTHKPHPIRRGLVGSAIGYVVTGGIGGALIGGAIGTGTTSNEETTETFKEIRTTYQIVDHLSDTTTRTWQSTWYPLHDVGKPYCY